MSESLVTLAEQLRFIHKQLSAGKLATDALNPAIKSELSRMHVAGIVATFVCVGDGVPVVTITRTQGRTITASSWSPFSRFLAA